MNNIDHHEWHSEAYVAAWIRHQRQVDDSRMPRFHLMADLVPFPKDATISILDIGAGYGPVTTIMVERFPNARVTLIDYSKPMLNWARTLLAHYASRLTFDERDLSSPNAIAESIGPFDAVVSALAVHNLQNAPRIRELYREVFASLRPGGCFLNMDLINAPTEPLQRSYWRLMSRQRKAGTTADSVRRKTTLDVANAGVRRDLRQPGAQASDHRSNWPPFPGNLDDHLAWLRAAGFAMVDCFWKELGVALVGGYKGYI